MTYRNRYLPFPEMAAVPVELGLDEAKTARRKFQCVRCKGLGVTKIAERSRMVGHITKNHLALDQVPFYCRLCTFKCHTQTQLLRHVEEYADHQWKSGQLVAQGRPALENPLMRNVNPYVVGNSDMEEVTTEQPVARRPRQAGLSPLLDDDILGTAISLSGLASPSYSNIYQQPSPFRPLMSSAPPTSTFALAPIQTSPFRPPMLTAPATATIAPAVAQPSPFQPWGASATMTSAPTATLPPTVVPVDWSRATPATTGRASVTSMAGRSSSTPSTSRSDLRSPKGQRTVLAGEDDEVINILPGLLPHEDTSLEEKVQTATVATNTESELEGLGSAVFDFLVEAQKAMKEQAKEYRRMTEEFRSLRRTVKEEVESDHAIRQAMSDVLKHLRRNSPAKENRKVDRQTSHSRRHPYR